MEKMMYIQMVAYSICFWPSPEVKSMPLAAELVSPSTKMSDFDEVISKLDSLGKINKPQKLGSTHGGHVSANREALLNELLRGYNNNLVTGHKEALSQPVKVWSLNGNDTSIRLTLEIRLGSDLKLEKSGQPSALALKDAASWQQVTRQQKGRLGRNLSSNEVMKLSTGEVLSKLKDAILKKSKRADGLMVNLSLDVIRDMLSTQQKMKNARQLWLIGKR